MTKLTQAIVDAAEGTLEHLENDACFPKNSYLRDLIDAAREQLGQQAAAPGVPDRNAVLEEAAGVVEPKSKKPCDCITDDYVSPYWCSRCDCGNGGDAEAAAQWCESANNAKAIRDLKEPRNES